MAAQTIGVSSWQTTNEAANQSTVYVGMTLYSNGWSFDGYTTYYGLRIGDAWSTGVGVRTLYSPNNWYIEWSRTYTHDANGYRGDVSTEAYFDGTGPYMPDYLSAGGGTQGAINYDRKPAAPSSVSAVLNADRTITVTSNAVSSPAGTPTYYLQSSDNAGSSWASEITIGGNARTYTYAVNALAPGNTYLFRMRASNSDGYSAFTNSNSLFYPSSGKRFDGSNFVQMTTAKRFDGSAWADIATAKRFDGSNWINLS